MCSWSGALIQTFLCIGKYISGHKTIGRTNQRCYDCTLYVLPPPPPPPPTCCHCPGNTTVPLLLHVPLTPSGGDSYTQGQHGCQLLPLVAGSDQEHCVGSCAEKRKRKSKEKRCHVWQVPVHGSLCPSHRTLNS